MRILIPPSNSSSDCDAADADCAPNKGVKLNIVVVISSGYIDDPTLSFPWQNFTKADEVGCVMVVFGQTNNEVEASTSAVQRADPQRLVTCPVPKLEPKMGRTLTAQVPCENRNAPSM